jgi:hypothetical protein
MIKPPIHTANNPRTVDMIVALSQARGRKIRMRRIPTAIFGSVTLRKAHASVKRAQKVAVGTVSARLLGSTRRVALSASWKVTIRITFRSCSLSVLEALCVILQRGTNPGDRENHVVPSYIELGEPYS